MPLRRADRLFDIIRILRAASQPVTAAAIADELEVTVRTRLPGCRDIAGAAHPDRGRIAHPTMAEGLTTLFANLPPR